MVSDTRLIPVVVNAQQSPLNSNADIISQLSETCGIFSDLPLEQSPERKFNTRQILQRRPSFTINKSDTMDDDTFDHILQVTSHHEAIMAYYYLDENNKVQIKVICETFN